MKRGGQPCRETSRRFMQPDTPPLPPGPHASPFEQPHAKALRQALQKAYESLQVADVNYKEALVIAVSSDGALALRQQGQAYRGALKQYCDATQRWLKFVSSVNDAKQPFGRNRLDRARR